MQTAQTISTTIDPGWVARSRLQGADPRIGQYALDVLSGAVKAGKKVKRSCELFLQDLDRIGRPGFRWTFDPELASKPIRFMEKFMRPTGDYDRMDLLPWQCYALGNIFGWIDPVTGLRRYRRALIVVGSGNGKTPLVAGMALYGVSQDGARDPEVHVYANSEAQAKILVGDCQAMVESSPALKNRFKAIGAGLNYYQAGWIKKGRLPVPDGKIRHHSSDARKQDGLRPTMAIFDEVHEMRSYDLVTQMRRSLIKRANSLEIMITTMGRVLDGVLVSEYRLADEKLKGIGDPTVIDRFFPLIFEVDEEDDPADPETWVKANPSMGVLLKKEDLMADWIAAQKVPALRSDFLTKRLDIFTKVDEASFLDWDLVQRNQDVIDLETVRGREAFGGFDISVSGDHCSVCLEVPLDDGRLLVLPHTFVPRSVAERDAERLDYYSHAMTGSLTIIDGEYIRQELLIEWFERMAETYDIRCIGYDPANATLLVRALSSWRGEGHPVFTCDAVRQGALTLNAPMKDLRERFIDGKIVHNRNRLFEWYLNNVKLRKDFSTRDNENWVPQKLDKYRKIDAFMAFLDAHTAWMRRCPALGMKAPEPEIEFYKL